MRNAEKAAGTGQVSAVSVCGARWEGDLKFFKTVSKFATLWTLIQEKDS